MLFFLAPSHVEAAGWEALLAPELVAALTTAARRIGVDPPRRALAWHVYRCLVHEPAFEGVAVALGGLPEMRCSPGSTWTDANPFIAGHPIATDHTLGRNR